MTDAPDRHPKLSAALRAVAQDDATRGASMDVRARLTNEVRGIARARRRRRFVIATVAAAASIVAVVGLSTWRRTCCATPTQRVLTPAPASTVASAEVLTAFMPLMYGTVPMNGGHIVRMRVPEGALRSYGLVIPSAFDGNTARTVLADVLVGNDGLARAVRFVQPAVK